MAIGEEIACLLAAKFIMEVAPRVAGKPNNGIKEEQYMAHVRGLHRP